MSLISDVCKTVDCEHFIEWEFEQEYGEQPYLCKSCKLVGQSYDIDMVTHKCIHKDKMKGLL